MKDTKTFLLLFVSILLLAVSVTLLWSWATQFRQFNQVVEKQKTQSPLPTSILPAQSKADTLKEVYQTALLQLDKSIDSVWNSASSVKEDLALKLASFYKLRTEITALFNEEQTAENIHLARIKIMELQDKVKELNITNSDVERENKRLLAVIRAMSSTAPVITASLPSDNNFHSSKIDRVVDENTSPEFVASDISFAAIKEQGNDGSEGESDISRFVGSFQVRSKGNHDVPEEVMVVVLQPDGKVLQKSTWESGSFETPAGKKIYSCKFQVHPLNGEIKKLNFSLSSSPQKGNYTIQLYHKGKMIANVRRPMS